MIGKKLKYMRVKNKIKQSDLSNMTNIPKKNISQYENGKLQPTFEIIEKIANKCGYNIEFVSSNDKVNSKTINLKDL